MSIEKQVFNRERAVAQVDAQIEQLREERDRLVGEYLVAVAELEARDARKRS